MVPHSLVVVAIDGLRAAALGAYGNTSFSTPYLDRLASESVVYDHYLVDSADVNRVTSSLWSGRRSLHSEPKENASSLASRLRVAGFRCDLVTDDMQLATHPSAADWDEVVAVETSAVEPAEDVAETGIGVVLATALEVGLDLGSRNEPSLLWIHLRGMQAPWDAPPHLAYSLRDDEEDPEWEPSIEVPRYSVVDSSGDDRAFIATCRYAGQVMALDECLEGFVGELMAPDARPRDLVLMGTRGFPLGEHGSVGEPVPYNEQFHVPLCYRRSDGAHQLTRKPGLVQPNDVYAWLAQSSQTRVPLKPNRTMAISEASGLMAIASPEWRVVASLSNEDASVIELYSAADDRWQANNVASRCPDEVEEFSQLCQQLRSQENWEAIRSSPP